MRRGERKRMPYENPERRRLNVMALATQGQDAGALYWMTTRRHFGAGDFLHFLRELPPAPVPTVIVLDNVGFHRAREVRDARVDLRRCGIYLYYLPPYSPDLNPIEKAFSKLKSMLRKAQKRTIASLQDYRGHALDSFSPEECRNYFASCGYSIARTSREPL